MKNLDPESFPSLSRLLTSEAETKVVKNFRHQGQDYSSIEKDPTLGKKFYVFQIDGETFANQGRGWPSPEHAMLAIKKYVRDPIGRQAVATSLAPLR